MSENWMETPAEMFDGVGPPDRGKKRRMEDHDCNYEVSCMMMEASTQKIHELEAKLNGIIKVGDWRLEQLKLMDSEKRAAEKTLEEERKLFAEMSLDQIRQNTAQIKVLQESWFNIMNSRSPNGNAQAVQQPSISSGACQASASNRERAIDGLREQLKLRSDERDKWKSKCKKLEEEAHGGQHQVRKLAMELQSCKAERVKLAAAQKEGSNLEEVCRDLLEQLEQRNVDLRRCKAESSRGPNLARLAELRQEILKRDEEIEKLKRVMEDHKFKKAQVMECIICMDEFGAEPDRQRAHWKDCNHANVCFRCTLTLWNSMKRNCPSCTTPASTMPGRLPPNIYL